MKMRRKDEELRLKGKNKNEREYLQYLWLNKPEKKDVLQNFCCLFYMPG